MSAVMLASSSATTMIAARCGGASSSTRSRCNRGTIARHDVIVNAAVNKRQPRKARAAIRSGDDASSSAPSQQVPQQVPLHRRGFLGTAAASVLGAFNPWAAVAAGEAPAAPDVVSLQNQYLAATSKAAHPERWYPYWWALPLAPYGSKTTTVAEVVPGKVWTFDQLQGLLDVLVNVRMTVIALESGGLWIHNPVAPTPELMSMLARPYTSFVFSSTSA